MRPSRITKSGHGKLIASPPATAEFDVEFKIHVDSWMQQIRQGLPPVEKASGTVALLKSVDGQPIPDGLYRLQTGNGIFRIQNFGLGHWELLAES